MKYEERDRLVAGLRELADFLEQHGHKLPGSLNLSAYEFVYDSHRWNGEKYVAVPDAKQKMKRIVRVLSKGGLAKKNWVGEYLDVERRFGPVRLQYSVNRQRICERVVVGTKEIPEETKVIPARTEEIVEWICDEPVLLKAVER